MTEAERLILETADYEIPEYGKIQYFPELVALYIFCNFIKVQGLQLMRSDMSLENVNELQKRYGLVFPKSFVEFLLLTGGDWGYILETQTGIDGFTDMDIFLEIIGEEVVEEMPPVNYPEDIFIIWSQYISEQIIYFKKSEFHLEDPPLYFGSMWNKNSDQGDPPYSEVKLTEHFSEYVNQICCQKIEERLERQVCQEQTP